MQLTANRFREFYREPEAVFWVFIFPILLAAGLGIAFKNRKPDVTKVAVLSGAANAPAIRDVIARDSALSPEMLDDSAAAKALRTGTVALVVAPRADGSVEYRYDGARPEGRTARTLADIAIQRAAGRTDLVAARDVQITEPGSRYIDFVIPGLLGMNLMGSGIWGLGFAVVDARKKKLLKRLVATPMSRAEYLTSFLLQRLSLLIVEVVVLLGFGALAFGVPLRGSLWQLGLICLLSSLAFSALGLLIASRAKTMEAASGLMNLVMLPMWILSGVFFSATKFPAAIQPVIQMLPLTAVINALRANILQGAGLPDVARYLTVIVAWLVVSFVLALKLFRWR
ncbi:MAG: ABC transporter permease [Gemmatimonadota bacterium]|nr:ABC transporter permease [Gemmatimonadota bacterium]